MRTEKDTDYGDGDSDNQPKAQAKMDSVTQVHVTSRWGEGGFCLLDFKGHKSKYFEAGIAYDKNVKEFKDKRRSKGKKR